MNRYFQKFLSLISIILILLISLEYYSIIIFSKLTQQILYFSTLITILLSSSAIICSKQNKFKKFINYLIIIGTSIGVMLYISENTINLMLYISLIISFIYAVFDIFNK